MPLDLDGFQSHLLKTLWQQIPECSTPTTVLTESTDLEAVTALENPQNGKNQFPVRALQYATSVRIKAQQNKYRTQFTSTLPVVDETENLDVTQSLDVQTKPIVQHPRPKSAMKGAIGNTFLTEMPEYIGDSMSYKNWTGDAKSSNKMPLPAFLPTIQAKTLSMKGDSNANMRKMEQVVKYLQTNELSDSKNINRKTIQRSSTPLNKEELNLGFNFKEKIYNLEVMKEQHSKNERTKSVDAGPNSKYRVKLRATGKRTKKHSKLFLGRERAFSVPSKYETENNPHLTDLVSHFARISMRQVQATLNSYRFSYNAQMNTHDS